MNAEQSTLLGMLATAEVQYIGTNERIAIRAALARIDALEEALRKAAAWVDGQGTLPNCRPAADCMLAVIRKAMARDREA